LDSGRPVVAKPAWRFFEARGKDEVINVSQRNSFYQTIDRLMRGDLVAARETERDGAFPERTSYEITRPVVAPPGSGCANSSLNLRTNFRLFRQRFRSCPCWRRRMSAANS
jgi:hypothetical protein